MPYPPVLMQPRKIPIPSNLTTGLYGQQGSEALPTDPNAPPPTPDPGVDPEDTQRSISDARARVANEAFQRYLAKGPPKATGARNTIGDILSVVGPLMNHPGLTKLSERLIHPGMDEWKQKGELLKEGLGSNELEAKRQASVAARDATNESRIQNRDIQNSDEIRKEEANLRQREGYKTPDDIKSVLYKRLITPGGGRLGFETGVEANDIPQTAATLSPGMAAENMWDVAHNKPVSQVGTVERVTDPRTKKPVSSYVVPSKATQNADKLAEKTAEARSLATVKNEGMRKIETPEDAKLYNRNIGDYVTNEEWAHAHPNTPTKSPTAEEQSLKMQTIVSKLSTEGILPPNALDNAQALHAAAQRSKTLTNQEKSDLDGFLALKPTPATAGSNVTIRGDSMGQIREYPMLDTTRGNAPVMINSNEINRASREEPGRYIPSGPGVPALNKEALLEDIKGSIQMVRQSLASIPEFSAVDKGKIALALRDRDPRSAISSLIGGAAGATLTPAQQDYLINMAQLHEQALAMRSVLGAGQGSEDLRAAILRTVPGPGTPNKAYAVKQLDAFEQTLNRLKRGVPSVKLKDVIITPKAGESGAIKNIVKDPKSGKWVIQ